MTGRRLVASLRRRGNTEKRSYLSILEESSLYRRRERRNAEEEIEANA